MKSAHCPVCKRWRVAVVRYAPQGGATYVVREHAARGAGLPGLSGTCTGSGTPVAPGQARAL